MGGTARTSGRSSWQQQLKRSTVNIPMSENVLQINLPKSERALAALSSMVLHHHSEVLSLTARLVKTRLRALAQIPPMSNECII